MDDAKEDNGAPPPISIAAAAALSAAPAAATTSHAPRQRHQPKPSGHYPPIEPPIEFIISRGTTNYPAIVPRQRQTRVPASRTLVPMESHPLGPGRAMCTGEIEDAAAGTLYVGQVLAGQPSGRGREYLTGVAALNEIGCFLVYDGEWHKGKKTGMGTKFSLNGETYTGQLVNGVRHGQGRMMYPNGDCYEGSWEGDARSGVGQLRCASSGDVWVGRWQHGMLEGPGTLYMVNRGKKYLAEYLRGEAKCGVWEDITAEELAALTRHDMHDMLSSLVASRQMLPALELDTPYEVLASRIQQVRQGPSACPGSFKAGKASSISGHDGKTAAASPVQASAGRRPRTAGRGAAGAAGQLALSSEEVEAVRLAAGLEAARAGSASKGTAVLGREQLRRVLRRLEETLGPESGQACSLVNAALVFVEAGLGSSSGGDDSGRLTYDQLMAAVCGAGNPGWPVRAGMEAGPGC